MKKEIQNNIAFIDGQNLYLGTTGDGWSVDFNKFRKYLYKKHSTTKAYYFVGYFLESEKDLYNNLSKAGFILVFKEHNKKMLTKKKGNVDGDVIFEIMKSVIDKDFNKVVLVSGDGDYKKMVDYLILKNKFKKIIFPNDRASSLYKKLGSEYYNYLSAHRIYIEYK